MGSTAPDLMYFYPRDLLIPRVDRQCTMRFCEGMAELGSDVEVVSVNVRLDHDEPTRSRSLWDVYGISTPFKVTILPSWERQKGPDGASVLWRTLAYGAYAAWTLLARRQAFRRELTVIYFKNYLLAAPFLALRRLLGKRLVLLFESHVPPPHRLGREVLKRVDGIVVINSALVPVIRRVTGRSESEILVAHQGVNLRLLEQVRLSRDEARRKLRLPLDKRLVVYTGKVHDWSGEIGYLLQAAVLLASELEVVLVGGTPDHVAALEDRAARDGATNVRFIGFVAPAEVFQYQLAADALVTYYAGGDPLNDFRSPGKLFEYMASGRPIVSADYPALRDVLDDDNALLVGRDDPKELAWGIKQVLGDDQLGERLAQNAYRDVQNYTWRSRAERVSGFVEQLRHQGAERDV